MIIRRQPDIASSEITPEGVYVNRRDFVRRAAAAGVIGTALGPQALAAQGAPQEFHPRFATMQSELDEPLNSFEEVRFSLVELGLFLRASEGLCRHSKEHR